MFFNVIVAGSRSFNDYNLLKRKLDHLLKNVGDEIVIVSGHARGADKLGERYAREKGYRVKVFKADWDKYGKTAGMIRNGIMAGYSNVLVAFWDGKSRGTQNMIHLMHQQNKPLRVIQF